VVLGTYGISKSNGEFWAATVCGDGTQKFVAAVRCGAASVEDCTYEITPSAVILTRDSRLKGLPIANVYPTHRPGRVAS
jgi:hypothetical protein